MKWLDDFVNSLSVDELKEVVKQFCDWSNEEDCPRSFDSAFPCDWSKEKDFPQRDDVEKTFDEWDRADCPFGDKGCWAQYYVWRFRKLRKQGEQQ